MCCCLVTDEEYPKRSAFSVVSKALAEFQAANSNFEDQKQDCDLEIPGFGDKFKTYVDPEEADKLLKVQKDLEEIRGIVAKSVEMALERGVKLTDLESKSKDLSDKSKQWADLARKNNQCCKLW